MSQDAAIRTSRPAVRRRNGPIIDSAHMSSAKDTATSRRSSLRHLAVWLLIVTLAVSVVAVFPDRTSALEEHNEIHINGNSDFEAEIGVSGVRGGVGTAGNPYIISDWEILADETHAVWIQDTTAFYIIRNISISHDAYHFTNNYYGVYIQNAPNGRVENVTAAGYLKNGLRVSATDGIVVENCEISNTATLGGDRYGIYSDGWCEDLTIANCTMEGMNYGMWIDYALYGVIQNNTVVDADRHGILIQGASFVSMWDNNLTNCGIALVGGSITSFDSHEIPENNTVNELPIRYICDQTDVVMDGDSVGQVILVDCEDVQLKDLALENCSDGIQVYYSDRCSIESTTIRNATGYGIRAMLSENLTITSTRILANDWGVYYYLGANVTVEDTEIIGSTNHGCYFYRVRDLNITRCNVSESHHPWLVVSKAIECQGSSPATDMNITITENVFFDNDYGVVLTNIGGVSVYHNDFIDNVYQASDSAGSENTWDNDYPSGGNYWDNYTGSDSDLDGIGDDPFIIDGDSQDRYPLAEPEVIPEFESVVVPVTMLMLLFGILHRRRRKPPAS